ncbi:MAG TPA: ankyrin repeat domain-containing protein [Candidatus Bathyarchaeia archaeon]|nr:ankyrin repeat domain-containing protein [Candidatus Bathyarchaeia archaeon]
MRTGLSTGVVPLLLLASIVVAQDPPPDVTTPDFPGITETGGVVELSISSDGWDIDYNILGRPRGRDLIWCERWYVDDAGKGSHYLSVIPDWGLPGPARIILVEDKSYDAIDYEYLKQLPVYRQFIPKKLLAPGAVMAVKTSEGRLAKLRVVTVGEDEHAIQLEWILYHEPGQTTMPDIATARERLSQAIQESDVNKTKELLAEFPELVGHIDTFKHTPLHEAARYDKPALAAVLIEAGANVNETGAGHLPYDWQLKSPLFNAIEGRSFGVAELLCKHGADTNGTTMYYGSHLCVAVFWDQEDIVELLLHNGAKFPETSREKRELKRALKHCTPAVKRVLEKYGYPAK